MRYSFERERKNFLVVAVEVGLKEKEEPACASHRNINRKTVSMSLWCESLGCYIQGREHQPHSTPHNTHGSLSHKGTGAKVVTLMQLHYPAIILNKQLM